jgi:hypothetical protein
MLLSTAAEAAAAPFQAVAALYEWVCPSFDYWFVYHETYRRHWRRRAIARHTPLTFEPLKGRSLDFFKVYVVTLMAHKAAALPSPAKRGKGNEVIDEEPVPFPLTLSSRPSLPQL